MVKKKKISVILSTAIDLYEYLKIIPLDSASSDVKNRTVIKCV